MTPCQITPKKPQNKPYFVTAKIPFTFLMGHCVFFVCLFLFFSVYLFLRERQSVSGVGAEREGDTESEAGSRPQAISIEPEAGLELTDHEVMT